MFDVCISLNDFIIVSRSFKDTEDPQRLDFTERLTILLPKIDGGRKAMSVYDRDDCHFLRIHQLPVASCHAHHRNPITRTGGTIIDAIQMTNAIETNVSMFHIPFRYSQTAMMMAFSAS